MVDLDADLNSIFEGSDLDQVNATFAATGGNVTTKGFFTAPTDSVQIGETMIEAYEATFMCRTSAIATVRKDDAVTVNAVSYNVKRIQKVGAGMSVCWLKT